MQSLYEDSSINAPAKAAPRQSTQRRAVAIKVGLCCVAIVFSAWLVLRMYTGSGATDAQAAAENQRIVEQFPAPVVQPTRGEDPKAPNMH